MGYESLTFLTFNRGLISRHGLARLDLERTRLSASTFINFIPRVLGSMSMRPGMKYLGATYNHAAARFLPFVFRINDKALLEFTANLLRVWISDALITRPSVSALVTNGDFTSNITNWTDNSESGGTAAWVTGGYLGLTGNGTAAAIVDQTITIAQAGTEHALRIEIKRGPVTCRVGTSTSDDSYVRETELNTGTHSLAFTPTGNFNIRFLSRLKRQVQVDSCNIESAGVMTLTTPWGASDLSAISYDQSGDVVFAAMNSYTQRRIERRATRSWSVVQYLANDGPFRIENVGPITMAPGALSGNTTLTASAAYFLSTHGPSANNAGALFRVTSNGQRVTASVTGANQFTNAIRVTGVADTRIFTVIRTGTWTATVTLQRSLIAEDGPWTDVTTYTNNATVTFDDGLDNQIAWYRIGVKTGDYSSGTAELELNYSGGSIDGLCRVTEYVSPTVVNVEVIEDFGALTAVDTWAEGEWSDRRYWPSAVVFHEGRLNWDGGGKCLLSVSDSFDSFDDLTEGDSGPINRSIGSGPVDNINWAVSLERLLLGGEVAEWSARSSSLDEPLTPTNFQIKPAATQGSNSVNAVKIDRRAIFVQKSGAKVFELSMEADPSAVDYGAIDLTQLVPEIGEPGIVRAAVQRQPDTRIHFVRSDGTVALLVFDKSENVIAWVEIESDGASGLIEDVVILPGTSLEDDVYYVVRRTVNGSTVRYLEKWAQIANCIGGTQNLQMDSYITYSGVATTTITGLSHLEGKEVAVWADGADVGTIDSTADAWTFTHTVSGGQITLMESASSVVAGLPYRARWKSGKLAIATALGAPLTKRKNILGLGMILADTHAQGLLFGRDFTHMDPLPLIRNGAPVDVDSVITDIDEGPLPFPGEWSTDARVCLEGRSPRPATILALVADGEVHAQR